MSILLLLFACNYDQASGVGDEGNLGYTVATDFDIESSIRDVTFITQHDHYVGTWVTEQGERRFEDTEEWDHRSAAASVISQGSGFSIARDTPGSVEVESFADGALADRITFSFDDPTTMDVQAWARDPWGDDWRLLQVDDSLVVGTQIAFLGIPLADDGTRLFTEEPVLVDAAPQDRLVPDVPVNDVWENGPRTFLSYEAVTFYAIEAGPVTFTMSLAGHDFTSTYSLNVQD